MSGFSSSLITSASSSNVWNIINLIQLIEIIALVDINYPERLEQFFRGFEFALLNTPEQINYIQYYLVDDDRDKAFNDRLESFGFTSSFILVQ